MKGRRGGERDTAAMTTATGLEMPRAGQARVAAETSALGLRAGGAPLLCSSALGTALASGGQCS